MSINKKVDSNKKKVDRLTFTFNLDLVRVQSMANGNPRLIIDLAEDEINIAAALWEARLQGLPVSVTVTIKTDHD